MRSKKIYLMVTIDTEEDNWNYTRNAITVENIKVIPKLQSLFDFYNVRPIYLCDFPVVNDPNSVDIIKSIYIAGKCDIGTHLHPWNTPPFTEDLSEYNSYTKNLHKTIISAKVLHLTNVIKKKFSMTPSIFRTGRWGVGPKVIEVIYELGYQIDTSVTPFINWEESGMGNNFINYPFSPYYIDIKKNKLSHPVSPGASTLLEIPASIGFNRIPFSKSNHTLEFLSQSPLNLLKIRGFLYKTTILKKIWLSPEQSSTQDMLVLSKAILNSGCNLLNLSFHSTSLKVGCGPYVKTDKDFREFFDKISIYLKKISSLGELASVLPQDVQQLLQDKKIQSDFI